MDRIITRMTIVGGRTRDKLSEELLGSSQPTVPETRVTLEPKKFLTGKTLVSIRTITP